MIFMHEVASFMQLWPPVILGCTQVFFCHSNYFSLYINCPMWNLRRLLFFLLIPKDLRRFVNTLLEVLFTSCPVPEAFGVQVSDIDIRHVKFDHNFFDRG